MQLLRTRRLAGAAAITTLALGLAACGGDSDPGPDSDQPEPDSLTPAEMVLASYGSLQGDSYMMETTMTIDGITFMESVNVVDGDAGRGSQDLYMSALLEASGEEVPDDPEVAAMLGAMFSDMHTEMIFIDGVVYMQISGGAFGAMTEQLGEDAWFTLDLAGDGDLNELFSQVGGIDLASQTETLLDELTDVKETGDGVYTGTLSPDSEYMEQVVGATGPTGAEAEILEAMEVVITVNDGLLQSIEMTLADLDGMTMQVVSEVVEIGGTYDIAAPDSDNTHPFEDLFNAMP